MQIEYGTYKRGLHSVFVLNNETTYSLSSGSFVTRLESVLFLIVIRLLLQMDSIH